MIFDLFIRQVVNKKVTKNYTEKALRTTEDHQRLKKKLSQLKAENISTDNFNIVVICLLFTSSISQASTSHPNCRLKKVIPFYSLFSDLNKAHLGS